MLTDPIEGRAACHVAPAEWRLLGWMEREGFDYDLYAETQLHAGRLDLDAYRVLVISTHPEYWSREMYRAVKSWVDRARRTADVPGGQRPELRGLVFRPGHDDRAQRGQSRAASRTWRATRAASACGVESEANLLGVVYTESGVMTAAPYRVVAADHWVFEGTGLNAGSLFGQASQHERIPGGASGHETDK